MEGAVGIAYKLQVPKVLIGIVLVGFTTTAPEFTVSLIAALGGYPEIALGNAVGSVIADDALAMSLGIIFAPSAILVQAKTIKTYGLFLLGVIFLSFVLVYDGMVSRIEGILLLVILVGYLSFVFLGEKKRKRTQSDEGRSTEIFASTNPGKLGVQITHFLIGLSGVLLASRFLVDSAVNSARIFGVSEAVIGLTLVAIGTSLPEIATCIIASRKGHGDLAFGDILGADLLNILWIVGASSAANPMRVPLRMIYFSFPIMLFFVSLLLLFSWTGHKLTKWEGYFMLFFYMLYTAAAIMLFYVHSGVISMPNVDIHV